MPCLSIPRLPVFCNILFSNRAAALAAPVGAMDLRYCSGCGHLHNAAFDPEAVRYSADYENSLHHSPQFRGYARMLARRLAERYGLRGRTAIEIASGQGDFLRELAAVAGCSGVGFDPAYRGPARETAGVEIIPDHFSEHHVRATAGLILCRHALEHIHQPAAFLGMVRRAIGDRPTPVYFEVPDARFTLRDLGVWDLIYEHCGYFTRESLARAFRDSGFRVDALETEFGGQFLGLHGRADSPAIEPRAPDFGDDQDLDGLARLVSVFGEAYRTKVAYWETRLSEPSPSGMPTVVWGAGSKGVSFVNTLAGSDAIAALVDLNPLKHGRFVPGTGHPVVAPEALASLRPERVIVLNPQYRREIASDLNQLGLHPELLVDAAP